MLARRLRPLAGRAAACPAAGFAAQASVYCFNTEGRATTSPVVLGLLESLGARYDSVGFFQPVAQTPFPGSSTGLPRHVDLVRAAFGSQEPAEAQSAVSSEQVLSLVAEGRAGELLDTIYDRFEAYSGRHKLVVIGGTHADGPISVPDGRLELNARIAATLESPALLVVDAREGRSAQTSADLAVIAADTLRRQNAAILGVLLNRVRQEGRAAEEYREQVAELLGRHGLHLFGAVPRSSLLRSLGCDEIMAALDCQPLLSGEGLDQISTSEVVVAAGSLESVLDGVAERQQAGSRPLVLVHASRTALVLGLLAAHASAAGPHPAAIILTGNKDGQLHGHAHNVLQSLASTGGRASSFVPILGTPLGTWHAARKLAAVNPAILPTSRRKIQEAKDLFHRHTDVDALCERLNAPRPAQLTPKGFQHRINRLCLEQPQTIVLPEAMDHRVLKAAAELTHKRLARIVLLGVQPDVTRLAQQVDADISQCSIVDPAASERPQYVDFLVEARKKKRLTPDQARDLLADANYFGTIMVALGDADGMVSGATHTTAATIRPGLQVMKSKASPLISSVFFMLLPDKVLTFADCAVNVSPTAEQLAMIACSSADTSAAFGLEPRCALLSYSTMGSGAGPDVDLVTEAVRLAKQQRPDLLLDGPLQYDAAVDPAVARQKVKGESAVAGRANVCIFPDLSAGNATYKAVQQSTGAVAIGPILQGLSRPVNDLSRGCTVPDIVNTVACTSIQAIAVKGQMQGAA